MTAKKRLVVGITGASGSLLALDLLSELRRSGHFEVHVVVSDSALVTLGHELPEQVAQTGQSPQTNCFRDLADVYHDNTQIGAAIASGSFKTVGMVVVPCSMKTLGGIHCGFSDNLVLRAADVTLKERRPLVLVTRETPLSPIHLRNMTELAAMGAIIMPPMMAFYNKPASIAHMVRHMTGKIMDVFGDEAQGYRRWS